MSDVDLDDLLGLDEPAQISSPTLPLSNVASPVAPSPAAAQPSSDPFHVSCSEKHAVRFLAWGK